MKDEIIYPWWEEQTGASKPAAPSWLLENIAELSKSTRTLHVLYVTFLLYSGLTVLSTSDRKIILDETTHLPIIGSELPYRTFMVIAPITALFLFVYFQLYLQALTRTIAELRENFAPVGKGRLYPWLITLIDENESSPFRRIERLIIALSLWWLLPMILLLFFLLSIKRPEGLRQLELLILFSGTVVVLWFWRHHDDMKRFKSENAGDLVAQIKEFLRRHKQKTTLVACITFFPLYIGWVVPTSWFYVDLHNQVLISESKSEYRNYLVDLSGVNLESANLFNTVLKRANLRSAKLSRVNMDHVNLESADLSHSVLFRASMNDADLRGAKFASAQLQQTKLYGADVKDADFQGAFLIEADLRGVQNLTVGQLKKVRTAYRALLDESLKREFQSVDRFAYCRLFELDPFRGGNDCDEYNPNQSSPTTSEIVN